MALVPVWSLFGPCDISLTWVKFQCSFKYLILLIKMVGVAGFEPTTPSPPD